MITLGDLVQRLKDHERNEREVAEAKRSLQFGGNKEIEWGKREVLEAAIRCRDNHLSEPLFPTEDEL